MEVPQFQQSASNNQVRTVTGAWHSGQAHMMASPSSQNLAGVRVERAGLMPSDGDGGIFGLSLEAAAGRSELLNGASEERLKLGTLDVGSVFTAPFGAAGSSNGTKSYPSSPAAKLCCNSELRCGWGIEKRLKKCDPKQRLDWTPKCANRQHPTWFSSVVRFQAPHYWRLRNRPLEFNGK